MIVEHTNSENVLYEPNFDNHETMTDDHSISTISGAPKIVGSKMDMDNKMF